MAINLNETATLTLKGNTRDFDNELSQLNTRAKELKTTLKEIEQNGGKGSEEWKKYKNELAGVNAETAKVRKEVDLTQLSYGQLKTLVNQLNKDLAKLKPGTDDFVAATKRLGEAEKQFNAVGKQINDIKNEGEELAKPTLWQKVGNGVGTMQKAFQAFMALQIIGYIVDIGKTIFETTGKFERYEKVLTTALGSEKAAKQSMEALKKMGQETTFTVDELTEGYVKLVNRGMRPSQKEMVAMADLAASQGKTFDDLVEAALDAQTGEFERLKEFGIRGSKSGDQVTLSFKGMNQAVKNTPEAIQGALTAFGQMNGVVGQNAKMMETLEGRLSNVSDGFDSWMVTIGEKLRPVFIWLLGAVSDAVKWFQKVVAASDPILTVFGDLFDAVGALASSLLPIIQRIFPNMASQGATIAQVMQFVGLAFRAVLTPIQVAVAAVIAIGQAIGGVVQAGRALESFLKGDFVKASQQFDQAKATFNQVGATAKTNFNAIANGWKNAMVDTPKAVAPQAIFAATDTEKKRQEGMTDEQKKAQKQREKDAEKAAKKAETDHQKHLEAVEKANAKALEDLAKLEADAHIAGIKDEMQREFAKLMSKRDLAAEEILRGIQDVTLKNQQIAALDKALEEDIARVAGEFAEKKRKKAEEEAKKRLDVEKAIIEQERQAANALYDWEELMAKNNTIKLADIHLRRLQSNLQATIEKLNAEEAVEKAKATRESTDKEQLERALTAIEARYGSERVLAEAKNAAEKEKIEKELKAKKNAIWTETSSAFSALLKGDLMGFVEHADKIVAKEKEAWQKRLQESMAKYEAVAQLATAAVQFLNKLEQDKATKAIEKAKRERDEKVRLLNDQMAAEKAAQDVAEAEKQRVTQESNDKIQAIKSATESSISSLEQQYRQLSSSAEKKKLEEQIQGYKENAEGKSDAAKDAAQEAIEAAQDEARQTIEAAQKSEKATIQAATNEKNEKIDAAEAARDAEIAAINKRKYIDQATRTQLLAEAKQAFETAKKQATDEATAKIDAAKDTAKSQTELAKETAKTKIELAKDQQDAELKAIDAVQKGDEKAAKEILANAKADQKEKIRLAKEQADKAIEEAEKEKREKLKKVEAEKQARIQNQKELNRQIEAENKKAADTERAAKQKAWKAQQDADIKSALIAGALATIKALASGFFPLNLGFAAATAIATALQVRTIRSQPMPSFDQGGFIPQGGRHGSTYGTGGIALIDRRSKREVGEMEGDEAIISREQTQANLPLIQRMFANARTPSKRRQPVTVDRNALGFRDGGMLQPEPYQRPMFLFGGIPAQSRRRYEEGGEVNYDSSGSSDGGQSFNEAEARAAGEEAKKQGEEQLKLLNKIVDAVEKAGADQRLSLTNLSSDIRQGLGTLSIETQKGLMEVRTSQVESTDKLSVSFRTALLSLVLSQRSDNADLVAAIVKGLTSLEQRNMTDATRIIAALKAGSDKTSQDVVKAIDTNGNTQRLALLGLSLKIDTGFADSTDAMVKAMDTNGAAQRLALLALNMALKDSLTRLQEQNKQDAAKLTKTTQDGFDQLIKRGDANLDDLTQNIEFFIDTLGTRTEKVITTTSRAEQLALDKLATTTKTSLDTLNKDQTKAMGQLSDDVTKALDTLSVNTDTALSQLSDDVTTAVDVLNQDQKKASEKLSNLTEAALKDSANQTTRSVDSLSVEVRSLKGSINGVENAVWQVRGAVNGVEGAVYGTNQAGRLDQLIAGISTFGGK